MNDLKPEEVIRKKPKFWMAYLIIPTEVIADQDLSPSEKFLFSAIQVLDSPNKGCFASNEYLGLLINLSPGSVSAGISKLKRKQFIITNGKSNEKRIICINPRYKEIHESNCKNLENKINNFHERKDEQHAYLKPSMRTNGKPVPYNNKLINNNSSLINPKELNNAPTTRASRCNERIEPISTQSTPKPNKKDSLLTKGSHEPIKMKISTYVEHWNTLPNVTHHSYFNNRDLPSKTYKTAHKLCSQLSRGMFNSNEISKTFLIRHKIDISILTRKFTKSEIIKTLSKLSIMFAPGHWAGDSNGLKPNLSCLLYNPMNQSSMFLAMFVNPNMSEKTLEYKEPKDNYLGLTRKLLPLLDKQPKDNKQLFLLFKGIESIVEYHRTIKINKSHVNMSLDIWFDYYIDFLDSSCDNIEINYILIKTGNWLWEKFINEYEEEWYVDHSNRWKDRDPDIVY